MRPNFKATVMLLSLTTMGLFNLSHAAVTGGDSGGGGGVYKVSPGKYLTLPEAGILINDNNNTTGKKFDRYYKISEETTVALREILEKIEIALPGVGLSLLDIVGDKNTFIQLKNIDDKKYQSIKAEYKKVFKSYGFSLDDEKFILPAYSVSTYNEKTEESFEKTYVLPDFDLLTSKQQAKILIHEFHMRKHIYGKNIKKEQKLRNALAVDVHINDILNGKNFLDLNLKSVLKDFSNVEVLGSSNITRLVLLRLQKELKRPVKVKELFLEADTYFGFGSTDMDHVESIDPSLVQDLQEENKLSENYAELLEGATLSTNKFAMIIKELQQIRGDKYKSPDAIEIDTICEDKGNIDDSLYIGKNGIYIFNCSYKKFEVSVKAEPIFFTK